MSASKRKRTAPAGRIGGDMLLLSADMALESQSVKRHYLKITPALPKFPFVDSFFPVNVYLIDKKENLKLGWHMRLQFELLYDNNVAVADQSILELSSDSNPSIDGSAMTVVNVRIRQTSVQHENRNFKLRVYSVVDPSTLGVIEPCISNVMTVVRYRLKIVGQPPNVWYKDEGGREKCMAVETHLVDEHDNLVHGRDVAVRAVLVYDGDIEVKNQNILKVINETAPRIGTTGKCTLKCRVDEVSKNHQKQAFCIRVQPDTSITPSNYDISADTSRPVVVRSKRNRRPNGGSSVSTPAPMRETPSRASVGPAASLLGDYVAAKPEPVVGLGREPKVEGIDSKELSSVSGGGPLNHAVHGVISWCQFVVKELVAMEWQTVGYEVNEKDNTFQMQKPIMRCPACWTYKDVVRGAQHSPSCSIYRSIYTYDNTVSKMLQSLVKIANHNSATAPTRIARDKSGMPPHDPRLSRQPSSRTDMAHFADSSSSSAAANGLAPPPPGIHDFLGASSSEPGADAAKDSMPPELGMVRGQSLFFSDLGSGALAGDDAFANNNLAAPMDAVPGGVAQFFEVADAFSLEETNVFATMAAPTPLGFAAFSQNEELIGFYQVEEASNMLVFVPLSHLDGKGQAQLDEIKAQYVATQKLRPHYILTKATYVTLEHLKEQTLLTHYSNQAKNFLPGQPQSA